MWSRRYYYKGKPKSISMRLIFLVALFITSYQSKSQSELCEKLYIWDFKTVQNERNNITRTITNEAEDILTQINECSILQRRNYADLQRQVDNEAQISNVEGIPPSARNKLQTIQAERVLFGEIDQDFSFNVSLRLRVENLLTKKIKTATIIIGSSDMIDPLRRRNQIQSGITELLGLPTVESDEIDNGIVNSGDFNEVIIDDGLIAYYPLDGNVRDESGNDLHGVVNGGQYTTDREGRSGMALQLSSRFYENGNDRSGEYIDLGASNDLNPREEITFCAWIYPISLGSRSNELGGDEFSRQETGWKMLFTRWNDYGYNNGVYNYHFAITPDKKVLANFSLDGKTYESGPGLLSSASIKQYEWTFICITASTKSNLIKMYFNGEKVGQKRLNMNYFPFVNVSTRIGGKFNNHYSFDGSFDDIRIYNRVLSEDEIQVLYQE